MKRALFLAGVLGLGLALSAMSWQAHLEAELLSAQPAGEFTLQLRLNGSPAFIGHTAPGGDGGTVGRVDAGFGNIVKTQCYSAACVCPGTACTCGNVFGANIGATTNGEKLAANAVNFMVLSTTNGMVTTAAASGSLLLDGGAGAECDHWVQ